MARRGPRRRTVWATTNQAGLTVTAGGSITPISLTASLRTAGSSVLGATIIRTHFRVGFSAGTSPLDLAPAFAYGFVVWDKTKATASEPNAAVDNDIDWMLQTIVNPATAYNSILDSVTVLYGDRGDLKSRRRLHEMNDDAFFVCNNLGTQSGTVGLFAKTLLALP
jgi:hypothetical protein